jgi:hypothetical protein
MKKASKPTTKKPAQKKTATKKSSSRPKRKAEQHSQMAQIVTRLQVIADKLAETTERLAELRAPGMEALPAPAVEPPAHQPADEHADDLEVASPIREE